MPIPPQVPQLLLNQFQSLLDTPALREEEALAMVSDLEKKELAEEALLLLRRSRLGVGFSGLRRALEAAARTSRNKRAATWHLDAERIHLRIRYARMNPLQDLNPSETLALLGRTLVAAGFRPALGLGKTPRPLITLGHPLPIGTEGLEEWADAVLQKRPDGDPSLWLRTLNGAACPGLAFGALEMVPPYATSALDLSREAQWVWPCPAELLAEAQDRVRAFLAAPSFELEKPGKAQGAKVLKKVEVRPLVNAAHWEGDLLVLAIRLALGEALNPRKLLGGILGLEPALLVGLVRRRVLLAEDRRLKQAEKFESKLKNIYEDAVLLGEGSNLVIVEEDEDEPLRLG